MAPLEDVDVEGFIRWRAGADAYLARVLRGEIAEHRAGLRRIFVAEVGGRFVGTAQCNLHADDPDLADGRAVAHLQALEVDPAHRRRGVGRALCAAVEAEACRLGRSRLTVSVEPENRAALALYTALGFEHFKESGFEWRSTWIPVVCLRKHLEVEGGGRPR